MTDLRFKLLVVAIVAVVSLNIVVRAGPFDMDRTPATVEARTVCLRGVSYYITPNRDGTIVGGPVYLPGKPAPETCK